MIKDFIRIIRQMVPSYKNNNEFFEEIDCLEKELKKITLPQGLQEEIETQLKLFSEDPSFTEPSETPVSFCCIVVRLFQTWEEGWKVQKYPELKKEIISLLSLLQSNPSYPPIHGFLHLLKEITLLNSFIKGNELDYGDLLKKMCSKEEDINAWEYYVIVEKSLPEFFKELNQYSITSFQVYFELWLKDLRRVPLPFFESPATLLIRELKQLIVRISDVVPEKEYLPFVEELDTLILIHRNEEKDKELFSKLQNLHQRVLKKADGIDMDKILFKPKFSGKIIIN